MILGVHGVGMNDTHDETQMIILLYSGWDWIGLDFHGCSYLVVLVIYTRTHTMQRFERKRGLE